METIIYSSTEGMIDIEIEDEIELEIEDLDEIFSEYDDDFVVRKLKEPRESQLGLSWDSLVANENCVQIPKSWFRRLVLRLANKRYRNMMYQLKDVMLHT